MLSVVLGSRLRNRLRAGSQQVELYLLQHGGKAEPNALYVIEGGGNDILDTTSGTPQALAYQIAAGIVHS